MGIDGATLPLLILPGCFHVSRPAHFCLWDKSERVCLFLALPRVSRCSRSRAGLEVAPRVRAGGRLRRERARSLGELRAGDQRGPVTLLALPDRRSLALCVLPLDALNLLLDEVAQWGVRMMTPSMKR